MASPSENCPIMNELPNFASATIMPHWQIAYTTFPARDQAKLERSERPDTAGAAIGFKKSGRPSARGPILSGNPGSPEPGAASRSNCFVLTQVPYESRPL